MEFCVQNAGDEQAENDDDRDIGCEAFHAGDEIGDKMRIDLQRLLKIRQAHGLQRIALRSQFDIVYSEAEGLYEIRQKHEQHAQNEGEDKEIARVGAPPHQGGLLRLFMTRPFRIRRSRKPRAGMAAPSICTVVSP